MPGVATGEFTVFGVAEETVYGTPVTVNRFYEILPTDTLKGEVLRHQSTALRGGTRNGLAATREIITGFTGAGDVGFEVSATKFGLLFKHLLGAVAITGAGANKTHTYTTGTVLGKSLSIQKQFRDAANLEVVSASYNGGKITKGVFEITKDNVLTLVTSIDIRQEGFGVAAASPSYFNPIPFAFREGSLSIAGSVVANVTAARVEVENPAVVDRRFLGGNGYKAEPTDSDRPTATGTLTAEFTSNTYVNLLYAGTPVALSLTFTSGTLIPTTAIPYSLQISIPAIVVTGETPSANTPGIIVQNVPWVGRVDAAGDPLVSIIYVTDDVAS